MKTGFHLLTLATLAATTVLAADDEAAQPTLALVASNFTERAGAVVAGEDLHLAPTGMVACALSFATNQTCAIVVVARAAAAAQLAVRLDTHPLATAIIATNLTSHSFPVLVSAGTHKLALAPLGGTNTVTIASVMLLGAPLPQLVTTNQLQRPAWDAPVGR